MTDRATHQAVVFDLGGVVMPSPLDAFRAYEAATGLPHRFLSEVVVQSGDEGAWSRLERGELTMTEFADEFEAECSAAGGTVVVDDLFAEVHAGSGPRPEMLTAIARIRAEGLKTAALTNNWRPDDSDETVGNRTPVLTDVFDVIVESAIEGLRKPDPRIYELTCARLGVAPAEAVFLDDLGVNLKSARALGMTTIKVGDPATALAELAAVLGFPLGAA
ncbi:MAG TPA: HAD family phosphatase [Acidimicrobiia bacterium]|nr:HAD family phosphatase [Acidimicrobiia bacterium]